MSATKGIEIVLDWGVFGLGLIIAFEVEAPGLFAVILGPLMISFNKPQYFRNGFFSFEMDK